ncbi:hypothetical protein ABEB36_008301 [Hypothenemus hampei]|uniref:Uncharacterized protein n=1 Tax=Hypothenemus hampei TaxID=57062 RepID=A0ABD1ELZ7_HYPHA
MSILKEPIHYLILCLKVHINRSSKSNTVTTPKETTNRILHQHHLSFSHSINILTSTTITRVEFALKWEELNPNNRDVIIVKQEKNILVKTNDEVKAAQTLQALVNQGVVASFQTQRDNPAKTVPQRTSPKHQITPSYSVVTTGVDLDIPDELFLSPWTNRNEKDV